MCSQDLWGHEWVVMIEMDREPADFLSKAQLAQLWVPRDVLFVERTHVICPCYKPNLGEEIRYYDSTSLDPFVNKTKEYPIARPDIVHDKWGPRTQFWNCKS